MKNPSLDENIYFLERKEKYAYPGKWLNKPIALTTSLLLLPIFCINTTTALLKKKPILSTQINIDALGRTINSHQFNHGLLKKSAVLLDILKGELSLCGASVKHKIEKPFRHDIIENYDIPSGIFSLFDMHLLTGLSEKSHCELLKEQASGSSVDFIGLLLKSILCQLFYHTSPKVLKSPNTFNLFGIRINNIKMKSAIKWILADTQQGRAKIGFFVNVNSINISSENPTLKQDLHHGDKVFANVVNVTLHCADHHITQTRRACFSQQWF